MKVALSIIMTALAELLCREQPEIKKPEITLYGQRKECLAFLEKHGIGQDKKIISKL